MLHVPISVAQVKEWEKDDWLKAWTTSSDSPDTIDDDVIEAAIKRAKGEIYSKLSSRYKFPLEISLTDADEITALEEAVNAIEFTITRYFLSSRVNTDEEMKDVYVQYNKAMKNLNDIARGGGSLYGLKERASSSDTETSSSLGIAVNRTEDDQDFTDDVLERMTF